MTVTELPSDKYRHYVPDNDEAQNYEYRYPGHMLEITILNTSDKSISFPIDTLSYALPHAENIKYYYNDMRDLLANGDLYNTLGVYPFVYQNGSFKNVDIGTDPFYEEKQLVEIERLKKIRLERINKWKESKKITDELFATYNWYIMNHMVTILPHQNIKYKLYFNPFLKKTDNYSASLYYLQMDPKIPYNVTFRLILKKNLYKFLSKEDKMKYPDLFMGIVTSTPLTLK